MKLFHAVCTWILNTGHLVPMKTASDKAYPRLINTKSCDHVRINSIPAQKTHQETSKTSKVLTKSNHFIRHFELFCYYSPKKEGKISNSHYKEQFGRQLRPCHGNHCTGTTLKLLHTNKHHVKSKSFVLEGNSCGHLISPMLDTFPVYSPPSSIEPMEEPLYSCSRQV